MPSDTMMSQNHHIIKIYLLPLQQAYCQTSSSESVQVLKIKLHAYLTETKIFKRLMAYKPLLL